MFDCLCEEAELASKECGEAGPWWTLAYRERTSVKIVETLTEVGVGWNTFAAWVERHSHSVGRVGAEIAACS